jgi:hypothetical protein
VQNLKSNRRSRSFNYKFQTYQSAYRKVRYWISILYLILVVQIWIPTTLPEKQILLVEQRLSSLIDFLDYFNNSFNVDGVNANKLVNDVVYNSFKYTVPWNIRYKDDTDSKYFIKVSKTLDSLRSFRLIDSIEQYNFHSQLLTIIPKLIEEHLKIYENENKLFIEKNGHIQSELNKILQQRVKKLQKDIDEKIKDLYTKHISISFKKNIMDKIEYLDESVLLSYNELTEKIQVVTNYLNKNILKTPYLDLPLSNRPAVIIILILSAILYWYTFLLHRFFTKIELSIGNENILKISSVTSTKNILAVLGENISNRTAQYVSLLFFDLIPILIFCYYTWNLLGFGILSVTCCLLLVVIRYSLYRWIS